MGKSETALLQALVLYLIHEAPEHEQNLPMVMEMLQAAEVKEDDEDYESPLDMLFARSRCETRRVLRSNNTGFTKLAGGQDRPKVSL